ncbi:DUF6029 family protein [Reichenbachiella ulvae]|uniref:DUF6029 family protein n=1 Tax=Reichenbachiella ulvae TaxID=2980104 RepID=A0ABT3CS33_9BACT|nr:DUF6029 family protein [Reichenbachiella ulvae]MCV9386515.1 DUF6029 family protein [Reichenbachiella ulvae]
MIKSILISLLLVAWFTQIQGQGSLRGSNLMEYQLGNIPELDPRYQSSLYDQLNLSYRFKSFGLNTRVEQYYPSFGEDLDYIRISQFKFQYKSDFIDISIGHLYESFGKGLLLRTYEIPSSIWETRGYRVRYGFYKDLLGAAVQLKFKNTELKLLRGEILDVTLPPTIEGEIDRRPDLIEGMELSQRFGRQKMGAIYMRHHRTDPSSLDADPDGYLSIYYDGNVLDNYSIYGEVSKRVTGEVDISDFGEAAAFGAYLGLNFYFGNLGGSVEYKNYQNFALGNGINDPPTLVKEHSYRLLNRSTHVPTLTDESGYQLELYYSFENGNMLTFNTARAKNEISETDIPIFYEYFLEYQFQINESIDSRLFVDYSQAPFDNENHRYAVGSYWTFPHEKMSSSLEVEYQNIQRGDNDAFANYYFSYTLARPSLFSISAVMELSADPFVLVQADDEFNFYPALVTTYKPNNKNTLTLFAGKRRGGPACNSGVCYDVLSFQGVELRITTRF